MAKRTLTDVASSARAFRCFLVDQNAQVATEYAIVMAVLSIHALGGFYAFRVAANAMLTFEQNALYNYGNNAP
jgi:Flp pilus assembly pilin Flp